MDAFSKGRYTRYNARTAFMKIEGYNLQNVDIHWSKLNEDEKEKWKIAADNSRIGQPIYFSLCRYPDVSVRLGYFFKAIGWVNN